MTPKASETVSSAVNRLMFEAGTFVASELRHSLEGPASDPLADFQHRSLGSRV